MNLQRLKLMAAGRTMLCNTDPFSAAGTNIFDAVDKRKSVEQGGGAGGYPDPTQQFSPSQAVPGKQQPYPPTGQGAIETATNRGGGSLLDSYMDNAYYGQDEDSDPSKPKKEKPKSVLDQDYSEYEKSLANSNFVTEQDAELADKALKGDSKSLIAMMNSVARRAAAGSTFLASRVASEGIKGYDGELRQSMPTMLAEQEFERMSFDEPALSNPKVQPLVRSTIEQFRKQYPKAPPAAIKKAVASYLNEVMAVPSKQSPEDSGPSMRDLFKNV